MTTWVAGLEAKDAQQEQLMSDIVPLDTDVERMRDIQQNSTQILERSDNIHNYFKEDPLVSQKFKDLKEIATPVNQEITDWIAYDQSLRWKYFELVVVTLGAIRGMINPTLTARGTECDFWTKTDQNFREYLSGDFIANQLGVSADQAAVLEASPGYGLKEVGDAKLLQTQKRMEGWKAFAQNLLGCKEWKKIACAPPTGQQHHQTRLLKLVIEFTLPSSIKDLEKAESTLSTLWEETLKTMNVLIDEAILNAYYPGIQSVPNKDPQVTDVGPPDHRGKRSSAPYQSSSDEEGSESSHSPKSEHGDSTQPLVRMRLPVRLAPLQNGDQRLRLPPGQRGTQLAPLSLLKSNMTPQELGLPPLKKQQHPLPSIVGSEPEPSSIEVADETNNPLNASQPQTSMKAGGPSSPGPVATPKPNGPPVNSSICTIL